MITATRISSPHAPRRLDFASVTDERTGVPLSTDSLDINSIDTAEEVAHLPLLDPAFQMALITGVTLAMVGGAIGAVPDVSISYSGDAAGTRIDQSYSVGLDFENESVTLTGAGTINEQATTDTAVLRDGRVSWEGRMGEQAYQLTLAPQSEETLLMSGQLGEVPVQLNVTQRDDGLAFRGRIDNREYAQTVTVLKEGEDVVGLTGSGVLSGENGQETGQLIDRSYTIAGSGTEDELNLVFQGGGTNVGMPHTSTVTLKVVNPPQ